MESGALADTLKPLGHDLFVTIEIDSDDRRNRPITLTAKGRGKLAETDPLWAKVQCGFENCVRLAGHTDWPNRLLSNS
jgi:DNA-binding MarR family transcriptional regulator